MQGRPRQQDPSLLECQQSSQIIGARKVGGLSSRRQDSCSPAVSGESVTVVTTVGAVGGCYGGSNILRTSEYTRPDRW